MSDASSLPDFEAVFDASPNPCIVFDPALKILAVNAAFLAATGVRREETIGRGAAEIFPVNPDASEGHAVSDLVALLNRVIELKQPIDRPARRHDIQVAKDRLETRNWKTVTLPVLGPDRHLRWILFSIQDLTGIVSSRRVAHKDHPLRPAQRAALNDLRPFNYVLRDLDDHWFDLLAEHLQPVACQPQQVLQESLVPQKVIHFLFGALISITRPMAEGSEPAAGYCPPTGLCGASFILGGLPMHQARVTIPGPALRMDTSTLADLMVENPTLRQSLNEALRVPLLIAQMTTIAACNTIHGLEQRLARWLLAAAHATGSPVLHITQDTIAGDLGIRRTGISEALSRFARLDLLDPGRNMITLTDLAGLERRSCDCQAALDADIAEVAGAAAFGSAPDRDRIAALFTAFATAGAV